MPASLTPPSDALAGPRVLGLRRVDLNVHDLDATRAFYARALGFESRSREMRGGAALGALFGGEGLKAEVEVLGIGDDEIELVAFDPPGSPYPPKPSAADPWFQHFAVVVSDMERAYAELQAQGAARAISQGGPQRLPPETGPVTAYKFRDPEAHPLELSFFPPGVGAPKWARAATRSPFLGIDHSAIAVADVARSVAFYTGVLGMRQGPGSINRGPTQARLDGLNDPVVDIATLHVEGDDGPHLELLHYLRPAPQSSPAWPNPTDVAATRLVFAAQGLDALVARAEVCVSRGVVDQPDGARSALIRDPDGHLLMLVEAQVTPSPPVAP